MPGHSSGQIIHHDCKFRTKPIKSFSSTSLIDEQLTSALNNATFGFVHSIILKRRKRLLNSHLKKSRTRWWERRRRRKSWLPKRNKRILTTLLVSTFQGILSSLVEFCPFPATVLGASAHEGHTALDYSFNFCWRRLSQFPVPSIVGTSHLLIRGERFFMFNEDLARVIWHEQIYPPKITVTHTFFRSYRNPRTELGAESGNKSSDEWRETRWNFRLSVE